MYAGIRWKSKTNIIQNVKHTSCSSPCLHQDQIQLGSRHTLAHYKFVFCFNQRLFIYHKHLIIECKIISHSSLEKRYFMVSHFPYTLYGARHGYNKHFPIYMA